MLAAWPVTVVMDASLQPHAAPATGTVAAQFRNGNKCISNCSCMKLLCPLQEANPFGTSDICLLEKISAYMLFAHDIVGRAAVQWMSVPACA